MLNLFKWGIFVPVGFIGINLVTFGFMLVAQWGFTAAESWLEFFSDAGMGGFGLLLSGWCAGGLCFCGIIHIPPRRRLAALIFLPAYAVVTLFQIVYLLFQPDLNRVLSILVIASVAAGVFTGGALILSISKASQTS